MEAPTRFTELLHQKFDGRLRIRWSEASHQWEIEQKVGRAVLAGVHIKSTDDELIRARDGYHPVMTITAGDRMPCPHCNYKLTVPVMDTADIRCPYCQLKGRTTRVVAGFWPLNDNLITHLQKIDPLRGAQQELTEAADRYNQLLLKAAEDEAMAPGFAAMDENYRRLVGIPMVGYTGKDSRKAA